MRIGERSGFEVACTATRSLHITLLCDIWIWENRTLVLIVWIKKTCITIYKSICHNCGVYMVTGVTIYCPPNTSFAEFTTDFSDLLEAVNICSSKLIV